MRSHSSWAFLLFGAWIVGSFAEEDLYKLLGVSRTSSKKEIKSAYRKKALDTHPDKNRGREEEAAKDFQKVVHAFEILSDDTSRRRYDSTGRTDDQQQFQNQGQNQGGFSWSFSWSSNGGSRYYYHTKPKLKDKFEVREAQSRILHIVSLEQLETVIVDDDTGCLERGLLIAFFTPRLESHLMDEMVYPYPFAAMSDQGIWWEDLLQTTTVRFHRSNKLTEFFGIPNGDELEKPVFVFGKRRQEFNNSSSHWAQISTTSREEFEGWMWGQIKVEVTFVNNHNHPVEVFWIHGRTANVKMVLQPGEESRHFTKLSHEWWIRDARTDTFHDSPGRGQLTINNALISWKITSDEDIQRFVIPLRTCFDLSGHCHRWHSMGECHKNPRFMSLQCAKTCDECIEVTEAAEGGREGESGHDEF